MSTFRAWRTCEVCQHSANEPEVQPSVGKLPDVLDEKGRLVKAGEYLDVIRCRRVDECRARAKAAGRPWPFEESRRPSDAWRTA